MYKSRTDLQQYAAALRTCRNFYVRGTGAVSNRPGTLCVAATKDGEPGRIVGFKFSADQSYVIEFGQNYARFYTDGGQIIDNNGNPIEIETPYSFDDLSRLKFAQSADMLFIVHPDYAPRVLVRYSHSSWVLDQLDFKKGPFMLANVDDAKKITPSGRTGEITLTANFDIFNVKHVGALFQLGHWTAAYKISGKATSTSFGISASIACQESWRLSTHGTWTGAFDIERSTDQGTTWKVHRSYTASSDKNFDVTGDEQGMSCLLRIRFTELSSGQCDYTLLVDGHIRYGIVRITAVGDSNNALAEVIEPLGDTDPTEDWAEGSWSNYRGWPSVVGFYQDRLCFANTATEPQTIWCSQTSEYMNFAVSNPVTDTDRLVFNLASRDVQTIRWMVDLGDLLVFTDTAIWSIGADGALTPTNAAQKKQDNYGAANVEPVIVGNQCLYAQTQGTRLRAVSYSFESAGYRSDDLSLLAAHLTETYRIIDMAFCQEPDPIIWMLREDGVLLGLTYVPEQGIIAWHRHDTRGKIESICAIPGDGYDELWAIVDRSATMPESSITPMAAGGDGGRRVERFAMRKPTDDPASWHFVDCGMIYDGAPTDLLSDLWLLDDKEVAIVADGNVLPRQTVQGGKLTLPFAASNVHVGLPYVADMAPMGLSADLQDGTIQSRLLQVTGVFLRLQDTIGGKAGPDTERLDRVDIGSVGEFISLFSGLVKAQISSDYIIGATVWFRQDEPLPATVLAMLPEVTIGG
jgi:hypothetical protein